MCTTQTTSNDKNEEIKMTIWLELIQVHVQYQGNSNLIKFTEFERMYTTSSNPDSSIQLSNIHDKHVH
jgi:hypothetical protein